MQPAIIISLVLFSACGIVFAIFPLFHIKKRKNNDIEEISKNLARLKDEKEPYTKASAFVSLLRGSYVLIHKMGNSGNNYNDRTRLKSFSNSLTPSIIMKINRMDCDYCAY